MTPITSTPAPRRTPNPWYVLALIALPVFIGSVDLTIVSAFLPEILIQLNLPVQTHLDDVSWVVSGYLLADAIAMIFMGRISDLVGRRKVYIACLLIFVIGSILVATAHLWPTDVLYSFIRRLGMRPAREEVTLVAIIIGRIVQAIGAGALVPVSLALVGDLFPPARRAQPLGVIGAVDTLGWVLGHLYGGILVSLFATQGEFFRNLLSSLGLQWPPPDWRTLFWINVPISLVALVLTLRALRHVPETRTKGRFDVLGTLFISASLILLVLGLGGNVEIGASREALERNFQGLPPHALPTLAGALGCLLLFILVESRIRDPLIELRLFRHKHLAAGALINLFIGFCLMIGLVTVPILVNVRLEDASQAQQAALEAGILLSALTIPMALASVPGGWLTDRIGYQRTTLLGLILSIIGFLLVWQTWRIDLPNAIIALEMMLVGVGLGLTFSPISAAVINAADDQHRGTASALVIILRLIGMTVAVASLTTFALGRVNTLAGAELGAVSTVGTVEFIQLYAEIAVRVLGELGLLGAVICGIALLPTLLGLGGASPVHEPVTSPKTTLSPGD
jgi:MFS family permease